MNLDTKAVLICLLFFIFWLDGEFDAIKKQLGVVKIELIQIETQVKEIKNFLESNFTQKETAHD